MSARVIALSRPLRRQLILIPHKRAASTAVGRHSGLGARGKPVQEEPENRTEAGKIAALSSPCPLDIRPLDKLSNTELLRGLLMHSVSASPPLTATASALILGLEKHLEKPSFSVVK
jgi:hypothetical protein